MSSGAVPVFSTTSWNAVGLNFAPSVLRALSRLLIAWNYDVRAFGSVEAFLAEPGWEFREDRHLDCLVVDVHMLGLSGLELQSEPSVIRAGLPIVFVTGAGDASLRDRAMADGAIEFLQKPFTDDQLIRAIDRALGHEGSRLKSQV